MTDPHTTQRERETDAKAERAPEPELDAEVIKDLDPPSEDSDNVRGGACTRSYGV